MLTNRTRKIVFTLCIIVITNIFQCVMIYANEQKLQIGDYMYMGNYYDAPILWRCVDVDENGPLMLSDKIISLKAYDAAGDNKEGSHGRHMDMGTFYRTQHGSNYWGDSNIRQWLNSYEKVEWLCGNSPDKEHVWGAYNAYDCEPGFLTSFYEDENEVIKTIEHDVLLSCYEYAEGELQEFGSEYHKYDYHIQSVLQNYEEAYKEQLSDKIFLLDINQLYNVYKNLGGYYVAYPTQEALENSDYKTNSMSTDNSWDYWLESPTADGTGGYYARMVDTIGRVRPAHCYSGIYGLRPAFYIDESKLVFKGGNGTESNPYYICDYKNAENIEKSFLSDVKLKEDAKHIRYINLENGKFRPDEYMTRYELLDALTELFEFGDVKKKNDFTDVSEEYIEKVGIFAGAGIISGNGDGLFEGERGIKRGELLKVLANMLEINTDDASDSGFSDVSGHWAEKYIDAFVDSKYINGYDDGTFQPDKCVTRAETIVILQNIIGNENTDSTATELNDVSDKHWAYNYILKVIK